MFSLFHKGFIGDEHLWLYYVQVTHTKFVEICNLLVMINTPNNKYVIINILKDASDASKVISIEVHGTLKAIIIYQ